jgi:hypothetical protein
MKNFVVALMLMVSLLTMPAMAGGHHGSSQGQRFARQRVFRQRSYGYSLALQRQLAYELALRQRLRQRQYLRQNLDDCDVLGQDDGYDCGSSLNLRLRGGY